MKIYKTDDFLPISIIISKDSKDPSMRRVEVRICGVTTIDMTVPASLLKAQITDNGITKHFLNNLIKE